MSGRQSTTKGQLFASPGVIIRKSVILKQPRSPVDNNLTDSSSVVTDSLVLSVEDTGCRQSVICNSEAVQKDIVPSTNTADLDENGNPVEVIVSDDRQTCSRLTLSSDSRGSRKSTESDGFVPGRNDGRRNNTDRSRSHRSSSNSTSQFKQHKTVIQSKTPESLYSGTPNVQVRQNMSNFDLVSAQVFLYDAYKEVLQLKSHGLAEVYSGQS